MFLLVLILEYHLNAKLNQLDDININESNIKIMALLASKFLN